MSNRREARSILPIIIITAGVILMLGAGIIFLNPFGAGNIIPPTPTFAIPNADIPRLSLEQAKAAYDNHSAVFVDVRGEPYYSEEHIKGALSISLNELESGLKGLNKNDWIITYCT